MNRDLLLTFSTTHHAMAAANLLKKTGSVTILPTPTAITAECGMALLISRELYRAAKPSLASVPHTVYLAENGRYTVCSRP